MEWTQLNEDGQKINQLVPMMTEQHVTPGEPLKIIHCIYVWEDANLPKAAEGAMDPHAMPPVGPCQTESNPNNTQEISTGEKEDNAKIWSV